MTRTRLRFLLPAILMAAAVAAAQGQSAYEPNLEIRTSRIPHAGNGVFTKVAIPKGAYLGAYTGEFITEAEYWRRAKDNQWQYMMGLLDCAIPNTGGIATIDGIRGNVFTRMNYAPAEFQTLGRLRAEIPLRLHGRPGGRQVLRKPARLPPAAVAVAANKRLPVQAVTRRVSCPPTRRPAAR